MKKILFFTMSSLTLSLVLSGCSKIIGAKVERDVQYVVQFNGSDFNVGDVVISEMPYDDKNPNIRSMLLNKAMSEHKCDAILLPRYEVISKTFGKNIIKVTGRAATFKTK